MVYVLSSVGKPLMPTIRHGHVRRLLKSGQARVVRRTPFTIQLRSERTTYTQPVTLGIDAGYQTVGFSAVTETKELISGEVKLLEKMSERLTERRKYRRTRRNRLRHRKPRFDNRKRNAGVLAPSIQHKLDSHVRLVTTLQRLLPITRLVVEVGNFDIQKLKHLEGETPGTEARKLTGSDYQQGEQFGFENLREYILHRDGHRCQNPTCSNPEKRPVLQVHHIGYWNHDRSDRPGNLVTLCTLCHSDENHQPGGRLFGWQPKLKSFCPATFMTTVRWKLVQRLAQIMPTEVTYGYITKANRRELKLEKSHATDAFIIAGGQTQLRIEPLPVTQVRRNNRSLETFYDAKYLDTRDGKVKSGRQLSSSRQTRNRTKSKPHLRRFRGHKVKPGRRQFRTRRYYLQPNCLVRYQDRLVRVAGVQNHGEYVRLANAQKPVKTRLVTLVTFAKGLVFGLG